MGTADAVYQNLYSIGSEQPAHVIILSGDHIYKMDYSRMLAHHKETGAEVTLATLPISPDEVSRFGVVEVGATGEVLGFQEKPASTSFRSPFNPNAVDASMGIYIFNTETLLKALIADADDAESKHDFGHNILPKLLGQKKMMAYSFVDENKKEALYWRDVGTLDAYYEANMDLCSVSPVFNLYDKSWPIRTRATAVSAGEVCVRRAGAVGHGRELDHHRGRDHFGRVGVQLGAVAGCARELVLGHRREHHLFAREYRAALQDPAGDYRSRRAHSRGHGDRLRPGGGQAAVLRDAVGADDRDARCVDVREPGGPGVRAGIFNRVDAEQHCGVQARQALLDCGRSATGCGGSRLGARQLGALVLELAQIPEAFCERAHQGLGPAAGLEFRGLLIQLKIGHGKELHVGGFCRGEFLHGDARFNLARGMLFLDGEEVQSGQGFRGILLNELPIFHVLTSVSAQFTVRAGGWGGFLAQGVLSAGAKGRYIRYSVYLNLDWVPAMGHAAGLEVENGVV